MCLVESVAMVVVLSSCLFVIAFAFVCLLLCFLSLKGSAVIVERLVSDGREKVTTA